jgi:hypothetical protein
MQRRRDKRLRSKVYYMHIWKYHNENPFVQYMLIKTLIEMHPLFVPTRVSSHKMAPTMVGNFFKPRIKVWPIRIYDIVYQPLNLTSERKKRINFGFYDIF